MSDFRLGRKSLVSNVWGDRYSRCAFARQNHIFLLRGNIALLV